VQPVTLKPQDGEGGEAAQRRQRAVGQRVPAELRLVQPAHAAQPAQLRQPVALELKVLERRRLSE